MTSLALGIGLGLAAGTSPGPLMTLALSRALVGGFGAGLRVALAPLITDAPIVVLCVVVLRQLPAEFVTALGVAGGLFVIGLGVRTLQSAGRRIPDLEAGAGARDLWHGALVNVLNPHPWIFWLTVGGPILAPAWSEAPGPAVAFLIGFYGLLVGTLATLAGVVAWGRGRLTSRWFRRLYGVSGVALIVLGIGLLARALAG